MAMHTPPIVVKLPAWRRRLLLLAVILGFLALLGRSVYLQSFHKKFLQEKGDARYSRTLVLPSHRGKITDRYGELLAISSPVESVWASPPDVEITAEKTKQIASLLGIAPTDISKKLVNTEREFVYLKRRLPPELAAQVMKVGVPGIYLQREYKRYYPAGEVTAHLVGFTSVDDKGQEGYELAMNAFLSGKEGSRRVIKDRAGHIVEDLEAVDVPQDGRDVVLSIDRRIQYLAHRELAKAVELRKALAGAAVVLDAKTGEVLAMVNVPTYNPNNPVNIKGKTRNRAIVDMFEPGSTMKPVTVAAGLESGQYQPDTKIQTAPGSLTIGPATIHDSHAHGVLTVAEVIQKSSNVGASKIALSLDRLYMWNTFNQLGFGSKTNIGFPGEAAGRVRDYRKWRPIEQATMSFGHGISVTLLQLARAYTVFANDGELKPVSLLKLQDSPVGAQVFSAKTANEMKDMLEMVVKPGGTALKAQVVGYRVAGKTGTTHKLGPHGYEKDKYVGSFVGMAPASSPRLIMAVMIDEPSIENDQYYGGTVAAPVFSAVMADALRMLAVPQDSPNTNIVIQEDVPEGVDDVKEII
ncbi:MAG: penicillin-binding protein 2 [Methylotenera sp.]